MKKAAFIFMSLVVGFIATSCEQDAVTADDSQDLDQIVLSAARYAVEADSVTKTRCKGNLTEVAAADLPGAVTTYINGNYANATILYAGKDAVGKIVVSLAKEDGTQVGVLFNADGTFAQELKGHGKSAKLTPVEVSALPLVITADISTRYSGAEIKQAGTNAEGSYFVHLIIAGTSKVAVYDANGAFVQEVDKPMHDGKKKKKR